jgi:hypothetical protein
VDPTDLTVGQTVTATDESRKVDATEWLLSDIPVDVVHEATDADRRRGEGVQRQLRAADAWLDEFERLPVAIRRRFGKQTYATMRRHPDYRRAVAQLRARLANLRLGGEHGRYGTGRLGQRRHRRILRRTRSTRAGPADPEPDEPAFLALGLGRGAPLTGSRCRVHTRCAEGQR